MRGTQPSHECEGTNRTTFKKQMPLDVLYEAISKVDWPEVWV